MNYGSAEADGVFRLIRLWRGTALLIVCLWFAGVTHAAVLASVRERLEMLFPDAGEVRTEVQILTPERREAVERRAQASFGDPGELRFLFHVVIRDGEVIGYAVEDAVAGKWGPIRYLVAVDTEGRVVDVSVLEYRERRGKPVARRRFLKQFRGKSIEDRIMLRKDIDGVSGATISSRGMADGVRKMIHVFHEFYE